MVWRVRAYCSASSRAALEQPQRQRPDHRARAVEHLHGDHEAGTLHVDQRATRHLDIVEEHLGGRAGALPKLAQRRADRETGRVAIHEECTDASVCPLGIGLREYHEHFRQRRIGDPHLAAVDDVAIAAAHRARLDRRHVRARAWLGHRVRSELAPQQPAEGLALLDLRPGHVEHVRKDRIEPKRPGDPGAGPGQFFGDQRKLQRAPTAAAELGGDRHVHQAHLARLVEHLSGKARFLVAGRRQRQDLLARKLPRRVPDQLLLVG